MVTTRRLHQARAIHAPWPRLLNLVLGGWLVVSAFVWQHSATGFMNSWLSGLAIALVSLIGAFFPSARWVNASIALWLFVSTLLVDHAMVATAWHNAIVALAVFSVSLAKAPAERKARRRARRMI